MIFSQVKLIAGVAGVAVIIAALGWVYFEGKEAAREECIADQNRVIQLWQDKVDEANKLNSELAKDLAKNVAELEDAKNTRTKRIIRYVESDPDSDTVIFDPDGLSILNSAQEGITTDSK